MRIVLGVLSLVWKLYIGIVFTITAILFYPIILPFLFSEKGKKRAFKIFIVWSWTVRLLCLYHVRTNEGVKLPNEPCLIVANHISYLDIFLLYTIIPKHRFLFLGKSELLKYPLIKTYFKRLNIPVYRGTTRKAAESLIKASKAVKDGWGIMIFPEGGIPDKNNPKMVEYKNGAFRLAKNVRIPIVPITFLNNHLLFSDPTKILGPARPGISKLVIHETIPTETIVELSQEELKNLVFETIEGPLKLNYPNIFE